MTLPHHHLAADVSTTAVRVPAKPSLASRAIKALGWISLIVAVLTVAFAVAFGVSMAHESADAVVVLGDQTRTLTEVMNGQLSGAEWALLVGSLLLAGLICAVVVPLSVGFALGVTALALGGVGLLMASPLIAVVLISVWGYRTMQKRQPAQV